jgi:hypothetical protein
LWIPMLQGPLALKWAHVSLAPLSSSLCTRHGLTHSARRPG